MLGTLSSDLCFVFILVTAWVIHFWHWKEEEEDSHRPLLDVMARHNVVLATGYGNVLNRPPYIDVSSVDWRSQTYRKVGVSIV